MPYPLTLATMLQRNRLLFGKNEVVSRDFSGIHRYTYADYNVRVAKLANALKRLGVRPGERVATFGWNSHRHLEAYFAVVTVDSEGYVQIQDRTRDLIKSGGEWISSIDLENTIMSHPAVAEAAVIGVPSTMWTERPMACVVLKADFVGKVEGKETLDFLATRVAKWWIPDEVAFVDAIPKTSVGKFAKRFLRDRFKEKRFA